MKNNQEEKFTEEQLMKIKGDSIDARLSRLEKDMEQSKFFILSALVACKRLRMMIK